MDLKGRINLISIEEKELLGELLYEIQEKLKGRIIAERILKAIDDLKMKGEQDNE